MQEAQYTTALDILDRLTINEPNLPAWNQRATVYFILQTMANRLPTLNTLSFFTLWRTCSLATIQEILEQPEQVKDLV